MIARDIVPMQNKGRHLGYFCYPANRPAQTDLLIQQFETETLRCISSYEKDLLS